MFKTRGQFIPNLASHGTFQGRPRRAGAGTGATGATGARVGRALGRNARPGDEAGMG